MSRVGQKEQATQNRVVQLFRKQLGYTYLGNWEDRFNNSNVESAYRETWRGWLAELARRDHKQQDGYGRNHRK